MLIAPITAIALAAGVSIAGARVSAQSGSAQSPQVAKTAPSFDCGTATGDIERLICQDAELAALDRTLASVIAELNEKWPASEAERQRAAQRGWMQGRDECATAAEPRACAVFEYRTRIAELRVQGGLLQADTTARFACTGGAPKPFSADFYNSAEPKFVVLTYGEDHVTAFAALSASGARYATPRVEFWEHQGEAAVDWFGTKLTCTPLEAGEHPPAPPVVALMRTHWTLADFTAKDGRTTKADRPVVMTFQADGRLILQADCNNGIGNWRGDESALTLGPVALTRKACQPSAITDQFVRDLDAMRSFTVENGELRLSLASGAGVYRLTAAKPPAR
jgi:uncharacterized protein/heat shock protein HslJ